MVVCRATNAVSSIPNWIGDWAADTTLGAFVVVSICGACLTNILGGIPSQRSNADQTFLSVGVQITSLGTNTHISGIIINQSFSTGYTLFVFLVPVFGSIAGHATSICKHERRFNRTCAEILECIVNLTSWTCHTFFDGDVPMLS